MTRCAAVMWVMIGVLALGAGHARAAADPLRIALECQDDGRTKACPAFLRGFVDETKLLLDSPRATAQVTLYVAQAEVANLDRIHLRFVGKVHGAPESIELDADIDTRADDDAQRAQLRPAFLRGVALYVAALYPTAVEVTLTAPTDAPAIAAATSPWGTAVQLSGFGYWTGPYQTGNGGASVGGSRTDPTSRLSASIGVSGGINRSPAVDGVSFDRTQWSAMASAAYEHHLDDHLAVQGSASSWRDDPKGQYRFGWNGQAGVEWDHYRSDDPRGNVLAIAYSLGYRVEGYNFRDVLGERFAQYPIHSLAAVAALRHDKVTYRLSLAVVDELFHPARRYTLSASPGLEIELGDHIDLGFDGSITRRELPGFVIPIDDPEAIGRADYAQPTSISGSINLRFHWDATNGVRNNRFNNL